MTTAKNAPRTENSKNKNVSVKHNNSVSSGPRGNNTTAAPMSYANAAKNGPSTIGAGGISADQLTHIVSLTVQSVLAALRNGS